MWLSARRRSGEVIGTDALRRILHHVYVDQGKGHEPGFRLRAGVSRLCPYSPSNPRGSTGRASHGILNRIGRITFRHFVEEQINQMAAIGIALRLMPIRARKIFILRVVARSMSGDHHHDTVYLREDQGRLAVIRYEQPRLSRHCIRGSDLLAHCRLPGRSAPMGNGPRVQGRGDLLPGQWRPNLHICYS